MNRDKRVEKAQTGVVFRVPFFAPGVAKLSVVFGDGGPYGTACTNGERIDFKSEWFDKLTDGNVVTVECHEVCHELLGHRWRAPAEAVADDGLWKLWNQAADHEVNLMLKEWSAQVMASGKADPFPFPEPANAYCADPRFSGQCAEQIYPVLRSEQDSGNGPGKHPLGQGGVGSGQGVSGYPPNGPGSNAGQKPSPHSMPAFGQFTPPKPNNPVSNNQTRNDWRVTLTQCVQIARGQETLPAGMERLVGKLLTPKVDWVDLLRSFLREQCADDWSWEKPNPYFDESGLMLPRLESEHMAGVVFAVDSSGSIDQDLLARFRSEQQAALDDLCPEFLLDIVCDARVHRVTEYRAGDHIKTDAPGGGGTDFRPIFEHCDGLQQAPKCLVILTDLWGTFPDKAPDWPVLWVVYGNSDPKAPFGEVVKCDEN